MTSEQRLLSQPQIEAFQHDHFVAAQLSNYATLVAERIPAPRTVVDLGGGCGFFADGLRRRFGLPVRVLDSDASSVAACLEKGVDAQVGDALAPPIRGDEDIVCFNLILHHLIGANEATTAALQQKALEVWRNRAKAVFVDEYIYDAWFGDVAGKLIYAITSSRTLSMLASTISRFVPSLRANTFGVGVRFRSRDEWLRVFRSSGYEVVASVKGREEQVSLARRLLLIRSCRRDSFLLVAGA